MVATTPLFLVQAKKLTASRPKIKHEIIYTLPLENGNFNIFSPSTTSTSSPPKSLAEEDHLNAFVREKWSANRGNFPLSPFRLSILCVGREGATFSQSVHRSRVRRCVRIFFIRNVFYCIRPIVGQLTCRYIHMMVRASVCPVVIWFVRWFVRPLINHFVCLCVRISLLRSICGGFSIDTCYSVTFLN